MIGFRGETDFGIRGMRFEKNADKGSGTSDLDQAVRVEKLGSNEYFSYEIIEYPLSQEGQTGVIVLVTALPYSVGKLFGIEIGPAANTVAAKMRAIQEQALQNCPPGSHVDMILELGNLAVPNPFKSKGVTAEVDQMATLTLSTYPNVHLHICALESKVGQVGQRIWKFFSESVLATAEGKGYVYDKAITNYGIVDDAGLEGVIDRIKMTRVV